MTHRSDIYVIQYFNRNRKHFVTRKHSNRMRAARLPTIHHSVTTDVSTTVCVGGGEQLKKF